MPIKLIISIIILVIFLLSCSSNALVISQNKQVTLVNETKKNKTKNKEKKINHKKTYEKIKSQNKDTAKINFRIKKDLAICKVRPEPSFKKIPFAKLKGGDIVEKIKEKGDWVKVDHDKSDKEKIIGWIKNSDIEVIQTNKIKLAQAKTRKDSENLKEQLSPM